MACSGLSDPPGGFRVQNIRKVGHLATETRSVTWVFVLVEGVGKSDCSDIVQQAWASVWNSKGSMKNSVCSAIIVGPKEEGLPGFRVYIEGGGGQIGWNVTSLGYVVVLPPMSQDLK